jgi:phage gpG-like protein
MPLTEKGSAELASALTAISHGLDDLDQAADDTVTLVVARARRLAPTKTGALARSITGRGSGSTATIGAGADYAGAIHSGVPSHGIRPTPFLYDAVEAERGRILDAYADNVQTLIERKV